MLCEEANDEYLFYQNEPVGINDDSEQLKQDFCQNVDQYRDRATGAHFKYEELCARLLRLQEQREDPETFTQAIDELEIVKKVREDQIYARQHTLKYAQTDARAHFESEEEELLRELLCNNKKITDMAVLLSRDKQQYYTQVVVSQKIKGGNNKVIANKQDSLEQQSS